MWASSTLTIILGLFSLSWENVHAGNLFDINHLMHHEQENESKFVTPEPVDYYLYMRFACQGKPNGLLLPVPKNCTDYFECRNGSARRMTCKNGMHFSETGFSCIDAGLSKCKYGKTEDSVQCQGPCCDKKDGLYPDLRDCNNFVVCVRGEPHRQSCGGNLKFCAKNLVCDVPERAYCNKIRERAFNKKHHQLRKEIDFVKPPMYMISHRVCQNYSDGVSVPIFGSCNKYYLCIRNKGHLMTCGKMQFNAGSRLCDGRTRIYCPEFEQDDIILYEDEYPLVDPNPKPWSKPTTQNPNKNKEDKPLNQHPQKPDIEGSIIWPALEPEIIEEDHELQPPYRNPYNGYLPKPKPTYESHMPPVAGQENVPYNRPQWGAEPVPKPQVSVEQPAINKPYPRPHADVTTPLPKPPVAGPPKNDSDVKVNYKNMCNDQAIGTMLAIPNDCTKYITCRWDWFEKRVPEVMSCPQNLHFNVFLKTCDSPERAGCLPYINKSISKYN